MKIAEKMTVALGNNFDTEIYISKVDSPVLRQILTEFSDPNIVAKMADRHHDWGQQGQCGCVMGCLGG